MAVELANALVSADRLSLNLLGPPELRWQGTPFVLPRRQARALLYRLASGMEPVARDELLLLLWPDAAEATARRNLTRLLSAIRADLPHPDILHTTRATVSLNPRLVGSDVTVFVQAAASMEVAKWKAAVELYRGPFLSGFALPASREFDRWQSRQQRTFESRLLTTLAALVRAQREAGRLPEAIAYARRYLAVDDLAEEMHRHLIELYARAGDRSAALRQFEQCALMLERELGVDPLPATRAAYNAAREGRLAAEAAAPAPEWTVLPGLDLPMLGRETAVSALAEAYDHFRSGGVIFIVGEPGIGKSRLLREFATGSTALVLSGNSHATEGTVPYLPLLQALRQALSAREKWQHVPPIWLAELSRLLPELAVLFPDLPAPLAVTTREAQTRLFETLRQVFTALATDSTLLLCLDDVHWADESSRSWLQFLTRRLAGSKICILATYRTAERQAIAEWQRSLERARLMTVLELEGLPDTAVAGLLRRLEHRVDHPEPLATRIHAATGGNAFFVLETIRALQDTGHLAESHAGLPLPDTVRAAVLRRARRLNPLARQILEVISVLAPAAPLALIHETAGRDQLATAGSLEQLVGRQLLRSDGDRFCFQHDLAREAIYRELSAWRRQLLHRRAATAMTTLLPDAGIDLATIAFHYEAAGANLPAIDYYRQAAAADAAVYAHGEAIKNLQQAVALAEQSADGASLLPDLYQTLADNLADSGRFPAAEAAYRQVLTWMSEGGEDPLSRALLESKMAATLPPQERAAEAETLYRIALARLKEPTQALAAPGWHNARLTILLGLLDALYSQFKPEAMLELQELAEDLLTDVGTPEQQVDYYRRLNQIAFLQRRFRSPAENIPRARRILAWAQESGNPRLIARQQFHLGFHLLWHGDFEQVESILGQALTSAERLGDSWLQNQCLVYLSVLFRFRGDLGQARTYLPRLLASSRHVGSNMYIGVGQANSAWLHYRAGNWARARDEARHALTRWSEGAYPFRWLAHWILLALALPQSRLPDAVAAAHAMLNPDQQQLPDNIEISLRSALSAAEGGDHRPVRAGLEAAVDLAIQHGYL